MQAREKTIKVIGIAVLVVAWSLQLCDVNHIRLLMHANPFHLAVNCWALWGLWRRPWWFMAPAVLIGWVGIALDRDAIGFSAALFALMGWQWNIYDCWANRVIAAVLLLLSLLLPQLAFIAHAVPFFMAWLLGCAYRFIKRFYNDTGRKI